MNVQIACNLEGEVSAIGPVPVPGARHDAYAFRASGLKEILEKSFDTGEPAADLGYAGSMASERFRSSGSAVQN